MYIISGDDEFDGGGETLMEFTIKLRKISRII
jgi:hypothetical protein